MSFCRALAAGFRPAAAGLLRRARCPAAVRTSAPPTFPPSHNAPQIISHVQHTGKAGLDVPAAPPAGQFEGLPRLVALMNACHAVDPEARPKFDEIVTAVG